MSKVQRRVLSRLAYVAKLITNEDFYNKLNGPLADPVALDSSLSTVCYSFLFLSELIRIRPTLIRTLKRVIVKLLRLAQNLLKIPQLSKMQKLVGTRLLRWTDSLLKEDTPEKKGVETLDVVASKLRSISNYISDMRIFVRLWGIPALTAFGISEIKQTSKSTQSTMSKILNYIDIVSIVAYQPLENIGFLADHKWTHHEDAVAGSVGLWYYVVSSRLWAIYVVLEVVKLAKEYALSIRQGSRIPLLANTEFTRSLISNLANLPLTVHWSLAEGCLPDVAVGFFGTFSSCMNTIETWKQVMHEIRTIRV